MWTKKVQTILLALSVKIALKKKKAHYITNIKYALLMY